MCWFAQWQAREAGSDPELQLPQLLCKSANCLSNRKDGKQRDGIQVHGLWILGEASDGFSARFFTDGEIISFLPCWILRSLCPTRCRHIRCWIRHLPMETATFRKLDIFLTAAGPASGVLPRSLAFWRTATLTVDHLTKVIGRFQWVEKCLETFLNLESKGNSAEKTTKFHGRKSGVSWCFFEFPTSPASVHQRWTQ